MSKVTKYFQVTSQLLLSYEYNQWESIGMSTINGDDSLLYHNIFLYKQLDGRYALLDNPTADIDNQNNNLMNTKIPDTENSEFYYLGYFSGSAKDKKDIVSNDFVAKTLNTLYNKNLIGGFTETREKLALGINSDTVKSYVLFNDGQIAYDTIKIYLLTGFVFNNIEGYSLQVKAKTKNNTLGNYKQDYVTLLNNIFLKDRLQSKITWLANPLYMNSKFYDRYIEIKVPDAYYLATENNAEGTLADLMSFLNIDKAGNLIVEFSTLTSSNIISLEHVTLLNENYNNLIRTSKVLLDPIVSATLKPKSNSDLFNIRIYEDPSTYDIIYYPVFGEGSEAVDFNVDIMYNIENGRIPLVENGFYDNNEGSDDFAEMYGIDACKWIIINELAITYEYVNMYLDKNSEIDNVISSQTTVFSNTIDYSNKTSSDGEFWKQTFIPKIKDIAGKKCSKIII